MVEIAKECLKKDEATAASKFLKDAGESIRTAAAAAARQQEVHDKQVVVLRKRIHGIVLSY